MVGDSSSDIEAGRSVHARTVFVRTKYNANHSGLGMATLVARSPLEAFLLIGEVEEREKPANCVG